MHSKQTNFNDLLNTNFLSCENRVNFLKTLNSFNELELKKMLKMLTQEHFEKIDSIGNTLSHYLILDTNPIIEETVQLVKQLASFTFCQANVIGITPSFAYIQKLSAEKIQEKSPSVVLLIQNLTHQEIKVLWDNSNNFALISENFSQKQFLSLLKTKNEKLKTFIESQYLNISIAQKNTKSKQIKIL